MGLDYYASFAMIFLGITAVIWLIMLGISKYTIWYKNEFTSNLSKNFHSMFMFVDSDKYFYLYVFLLLLLPASVYLSSENVVYTVCTVILLLITPKNIHKFLFNRRQKQLVTSLPDTLVQMSGSLRAGASLAISIEAMVAETKGPIAQEFSLVLREMRIGVSMDDAFDNLAKRVNEEEYTLVVAASRIAREVGGNLSETFELLSNTLRKKIMMEGKIKALTAQGIMQGWVVGLLPIGMMLILMQMEPEAMRPLLHSVVGWGFLTVVIIMELLGAVMIKKIVTIDI